MMLDNFWWDINFLVPVLPVILPQTEKTQVMMQMDYVDTDLYISCFQLNLECVVLI